jgi:hypothetical protein
MGTYLVGSLLAADGSFAAFRPANIASFCDGRLAGLGAFLAVLGSLVAFDRLRIVLLGD